MMAGLLMKKIGRKALLVGGDYLCFACLLGLAIFSYLLDKNSESKSY